METVYQPAGFRGNDGERVAIKDRRAKTSQQSWTVQLTVDRNSSRVTLIFEDINSYVDTATQMGTLSDGKGTNSFWTKHILREGEDSEKNYKLRNAQRNLNVWHNAPEAEAISARSTKFANMLSRAQVAYEQGYEKPAAMCTYIDLKKINLKRMLYDFAYCLKRANIGFAGNEDVRVNFLNDCVVTVNQGGGTTSSNTVLVGVARITRGTHPTDDKVTYNVNHVSGP